MKSLKKPLAYALLIPILLCGCKGADKSAAKFTFTVLKAGQADAIIMQTQNRSILLDLGEKDDGDDE